MTARHDRDEDRLVWLMRADERDLLVLMLEQLDQAIDGPVDDPIVQRLFPSVVEDDADEDAQLRMLIAGELLLRRHEAIRTVLAVIADAAAPRRRARGDATITTGGGGETLEVVLDDELPNMMLSVLNDVRLALASSVGLTAVELPQLVDDADDRRHALLEMLDYFAVVQMRLLRHIDPAAVAHSDPDEGD